MINDTRRIAWIGLAALAAVWPAPPGHAAARQNRLGPDLFLAIARRDHAAVKGLLSRGADPNARNFLRFTPLMFAAITRQAEVATTLLRAGAALDAQSPFGTALTFAELGEDPRMVQQLLGRGAHVNPRRPDGITVLMLAARNGHVEIARSLLDKKVSLQARDNDGATALIYAARAGQTETTRLLARRAMVDAADSQGWTALTHAVANGHLECATLLLDRGANANARDKQGRTPLIIAASYGDQPAIARLLLDRGADLHAQDGRSRTALAVAVTRGNEACANVLRKGSVAFVPVGDILRSPQTARAAIEASLPLIQHSMQLFLDRTGCASCHQEGLGRMATGLARERGFAINSSIERAQVKRIIGMLTMERPLVVKALKNPRMAKNVPGAEIGELVPASVYLLSGLAAHPRPSSPMLSEVALLLARQQATDGRWHFTIPRVPMQSSHFTMTALALRVMQTYGPKDRSGELTRRTHRARAWLVSAPARTTEDKAFRLLGLKWADGSREELRKAAEELRVEQRADGGWAQLRSLSSDAYATGQALFALHQAGEVSLADPDYQRGVDFLLRTQEDDGSWFVNKRAIPANNYFDAGFPHGQSQYSSFAGTCWATMALLLSAERPGAQAAR